jgi:hypothetical protein
MAGQLLRDVVFVNSSKRRAQVVALCGGVIGPLLMLIGLNRVSAVAGSLLLNLEGRFTMAIAVLVLADASGAALVLVAALAISIYKPWGVVGRVTRGLRVFIAADGALVVAFVMHHLSGHSPHRHSH